MADRKRLNRCFSNFVSNAIQAMPDGGNLAVTTSVRQELIFPGGAHRSETGIGIAFSDTGQGIPNERLSRIFDPFYTTKEKGLGLGMAIAHRITEDHGGMIDVASEVGQGTTFTVSIPVNGAARVE